MGAFNQLNGAIFDAAAIEARISAIDGRSIYNQRDGGILDFDSLARRLTALDGKVAVGQGGIEFDVDTFMRRLAAIEAGTTDVDAAAWATAVIANGGTYSGTTLAAVSAFCVSAKVNGYWNKLNRINLICGDQLTAARTPLKVGGGATIDTNVSFISGNYTESTGLTGNATTKYLRTGLVPSVSLTLNDTHISAYNRGSSGGITIGAGTASPAPVFRLYAPSGATAISQDSSETAGAGSINAVISTPYGFVVGSRTASNAHALYRNGSSIASEAASGGVTLPAVELFVFADDLSGSPAQLGTGPLASYSFGSGLTAADVTAYNIDMQTFQTALGRNV